MSSTPDWATWVMAGTDGLPWTRPLRLRGFTRSDAFSPVACRYACNSLVYFAYQSTYLPSHIKYNITQIRHPQCTPNNNNKAAFHSHWLSAHSYRQTPHKKLSFKKEVKCDSFGSVSSQFQVCGATNNELHKQFTITTTNVTLMLCHYTDIYLLVRALVRITIYNTFSDSPAVKLKLQFWQNVQRYLATHIAT